MSIIKIANVETGEEIERQMTDEELAQRANDEAIYQQLMELQAQAAAKKAAAEAKLAVLGLTPDDLKALGLG